MARTDTQLTPAEIAIIESLEPLGTAGQLVRVNAWQTWFEYFTNSGWLTGFTASENTSAPNTTVYVDALSASWATTNADVAIVPKWTGAFTLAIADNLSTWGNKRGTNSIDLQTKRSANTQVASWVDSVVLWVSNTASAANSIAIWSLNITSTAESTAVWTSNTASWANQSTAIWAYNTASADSSTAVWMSNTASGQYSTAIWSALSATWARALSIGWWEWTAQSFGETVLWLFPTTWAWTAWSYVATDRLFVIWNWTSTWARSNALVILKNGNTTIAGTAASVNFIEGYTTTATAAGTTTLTVASTYSQFFTGSTTQTVVMPVATTLVNGQSWQIFNNSTGLVTIQSSWLNTILVLGASTSALVECINTAWGTGTASWKYVYEGTVVASGKVLTVSNTITVAGTDATTMTFPSSNATIARTDAGQTFTGTQLLAENASIGLDPAWSADWKYTGITITATAGYTQAFWDLVYLDPTDSRWELCDANSAAWADWDSRGMIAMVVVPWTDWTSCTLLLQGVIRADAKFPTFTVNNPIYVSETAGSVTQTQPVTTDVVIRIVGAALTTDEMYFNPDFTYTTHT